MKYHIEVLIPEEEIKKKVRELGQQITKDYQGSEDVILVGLLRGSTIFLADLSREIDLEAKLDFMVVSSYGSSMESSREVKINKDLEEDIRGKDVIIVEDIIDTGYTLEKVRDYLLLKNPASFKICTLLDKPERREVPVEVDYVGFQIPDVFVVGYGIDYAQKHRNLPYIGKVVPD
ncbi:MAG: hypoxanthine phosphoribosyltransferase [Deltaproteobacteria bacterium]|nr:hypoxanthine phosphoribosyltransferase [Deltaproteobacteria bacterium]